jgi:hypothetical protein
MDAQGLRDLSYLHVRIRNVVACAVLAIPLIAVRPAGAPLDMRLHVDASLRTNAVYHLACLGGSISCSREIFERFWKDRLHESVDDRQSVTTWQRLLASAVERAPEMKPSPLLTNAAPMHPDGLTRRQVIAGLIETRSAAALQRRASGVSRAEASALIGLVDRMEQRLRPWWRAEGERSAKARIQGVTETARRNHMMRALGRMAQFLESVPPSRDAYVHAIAPPEPESKDYSATAILNHLPIEAVTAANDPNEIVQGAVHEIAHYLYDYIPPDKHLALVNEFVASGAPSIAGIYSYLHEAIAISAQALYSDALKNGASAVEDDGDTGYKHPYIPVLASVAAPLVKAAVSRDEHLVGVLEVVHCRRPIQARRPPQRVAVRVRASGLGDDKWKPRIRRRIPAHAVSSWCRAVHRSGEGRSVPRRSPRAVFRLRRTRRHHGAATRPAPPQSPRLRLRIAARPGRLSRDSGWQIRRRHSCRHRETWQR